MSEQLEITAFPVINNAYASLFKPGQLTFGVISPVESYAVGDLPTMQRHIERIQLAEQLGFAAVWLRDVPFNVPSFGDAGQMFDPFVYLGFLAAQTENIALCTGSIILPLRHPAHVAKSAATVDVLSGGRVILGIASGDRPQEYPALHYRFDDRGQRFQDSYDYIRRMAEAAPSFENPLGSLYGGMDMLPKPTGGKIPLLITGGSQQSPAWIACHGDGWITYPRNIATQAKIIGDWRARTRAAGGPDKPAVQSLYIDLAENPDEPPQPIHLGFRSGVNALRKYVRSLQGIGINHVGLNLRFNQADIETTLQRLADELLPDFT